MGSTIERAGIAVLEPIKEGEEQGLYSCWCGCGGFYRRRELTQHHKIPDRYRGAPGYKEVVRQFAEDDDLEGGLIVLVCPTCHGKLNMIDDNNKLRYARLNIWLAYWTAEGRALGKNMFYRGNRLIGQSLSAKRGSKGPKRLRRS